MTDLLRRIEAAIAIGSGRDPRRPEPPREGIFRDHACWKCRDGQKPCVNGAPHRCEYPHARNE